MVIDSALADSQALYRAAPEGAPVCILRPGTNAPGQIAQALAETPTVSVLHIFAHGAPGELRLAGSRLTGEDFDGAARSALENIGASLGPDAEILIYGCRFGAGEAGREAMAQLAGIAGATVAAATRPVGHEDRGGCWTLDVCAGGRPAAAALKAAEFRGVLDDEPTEAEAIEITDEDTNVTTVYYHKPYGTGFFEGDTNIVTDVTEWGMSYSWSDGNGGYLPLDLSNMFKGASNFNQDIGDWYTGTVVNMSGMFEDAASFKRDLQNWNTSNVTDMSNMFKGAGVFRSTKLYDWDTWQVVDMSGMFWGTRWFDPWLNWDTGNVKDMSDMFRESGLTSDCGLDAWNTGNVTDMSRMFRDALWFDSSLEGWNTSNVTDMSGMFRGARSFKYGHIDDFDTSSVTDMSAMFRDATAFTGNQDGHKIFADWDTSSVTDMSQMFRAAESFNGNISFFSTGNVTNMFGMFWGAWSFNKHFVYSEFNSDNLDANGEIIDTEKIVHWDTGNVANMSYMFAGAKKFNAILEFDTSSVTNMSRMFWLAESYTGTAHAMGTRNQWSEGRERLGRFRY